MASVGVTGGVATGKSTVSRLLITSLDTKCAVEHFDADFEARRLTDQDSVVKEEIRSAFGNQVFGPDGNLSRERLRDLVFHDLAARKTLESILHPRIRAAWI
ncbi:MAG: dephospho-CoA kinase, partial [Verrucomicrobia bacterium]|nr:dephospho-CoA kinase [Verrucomicrobiota bacterium]